MYSILKKVVKRLKVFFSMRKLRCMQMRLSRSPKFLGNNGQKIILKTTIKKVHNIHEKSSERKKSYLFTNY